MNAAMRMRGGLFLALVIAFSAHAVEQEDLWRGRDETASCSGRQQSPVNLAPPFVSEQNSLSLDYAPQALSMTVQNAGNRLALVAEGMGQVSYRGDSYQAQYVEFHSPAEHTLNGHKMPLEMQIYHSSPASGKTLAVSLLFKKSQRGGSSFLEPILETAKDARKRVGGGPPKRTTSQLSLEQLIGGRASDYFSYSTDSCGGRVGQEWGHPPVDHWVILSKVKKISAAQLALLQQAVPRLARNSRKTKPLNQLTQVFSSVAAHGGHHHRHQEQYVQQQQQQRAVAPPPPPPPPPPQPQLVQTSPQPATKVASLLSLKNRGMAAVAQTATTAAQQQLPPPQMDPQQMQLTMEKAQQMLANPLPLNPQLPAPDQQQMAAPEMPSLLPASAAPQLGLAQQQQQQQVVDPSVQPGQGELQQQFQQQQALLQQQLQEPLLTPGAAPGSEQQQQQLGLMQQAKVAQQAQATYTNMQQQFQQQQAALAQEMQQFNRPGGAVVMNGAVAPPAQLSALQYQQAHAAAQQYETMDTKQFQQQQDQYSQWQQQFQQYNQGLQKQQADYQRQLALSQAQAAMNRKGYFAPPPPPPPPPQSYLTTGSSTHHTMQAAKAASSSSSAAAEQQQQQRQLAAEEAQLEQREARVAQGEAMLQQRAAQRQQEEAQLGQREQAERASEQSLSVAEQRLDAREQQVQNAQRTLALMETQLRSQQDLVWKELKKAQAQVPVAAANPPQQRQSSGNKPLFQKARGETSKDAETFRFEMNSKVQRRHSAGSLASLRKGSSSIFTPPQQQQAQTQQTQLLQQQMDQPFFRVVQPYEVQQRALVQDPSPAEEQPQQQPSAFRAVAQPPREVTMAMQQQQRPQQRRAFLQESTQTNTAKAAGKVAAAAPAVAAPPPPAENDEFRGPPPGTGSESPGLLQTAKAGASISTGGDSDLKVVQAANQASASGNDEEDATNTEESGASDSEDSAHQAAPDVANEDSSRTASTDASGANADNDDAEGILLETSSAVSRAPPQPRKMVVR